MLAFTQVYLVFEGTLPPEHVSHFREESDAQVDHDATAHVTHEGVG
jgi:hypothetical protein